MLVNKTELAKILKVSSSTLSEWLARDHAFPVAERGGNGVEWWFETDDVFAYLVERRRQERERRAAQSRQLAGDHPTLEGLLDGEGGAPTWEERRKLLKALAIEEDLRKRRQLLLNLAEVRKGFDVAWPLVERLLTDLPARLAEVHKLGPEITARLAGEVEERRAGMRARLERLGVLASAQG